jgi:hypothetical protein
VIETAWDLVRESSGLCGFWKKWIEKNRLTISNAYMQTTLFMRFKEIGKRRAAYVSGFGFGARSEKSLIFGKSNWR